MPRLSSSSAIAAADRVAVPRSITRDSSQVIPESPGGSAIEPARMVRLTATDGVVAACFTSSVAPLPRTLRTGVSGISDSDFRLTFSVADRQRIVPANRAIGWREDVARRGGDLFERDRGNTARR